MVLTAAGLVVMINRRFLTRVTVGDSSIAGETTPYTHPVKEDVKKKIFSPPLGEMRVW
jgi:hypothetical protein